MKVKVSLFCTARTFYMTSVWTLGTISFLTLTAITVDRFLAVHLHLRYQELVTTKLYSLIVFLIWVLSLFIGIFRMFVETGGNILTVGVIIFIFLLILNVYIHIKISRVIHRHTVQIQAQQQAAQQSIDMPRYKKSVNTMYYVIGAFVLCYVPHFVSLAVLAVVKEWTYAIRCLLELLMLMLMEY
jgi:Na+-transporting methylmalonyl-CoA/oxaloacetate decarboxylase gamma subunit